MDLVALNSLDGQIVEFLASGVPAVEVAGICGVSLEVIQSKLGDLKGHIQERGKALRAERVENAYAQTEEKILKRIKKEAEDDFAEVGPLIRALEVVAKNRVMYKNPLGLGAPASSHNINVINLHLPAAATMAPTVTLNTQREIISVGDRNMASMPIEGVQTIFKTFDKEIQDVTPQANAA